MNAISFKKWVSTILLLAITISLCGCSTNRTAASQDEHLTTTTAFIVLNGANVPALNSSAIASFVDSQHRILLTSVVLDGSRFT